MYNDKWATKIVVCLAISIIAGCGGGGGGANPPPPPPPPSPPPPSTGPYTIGGSVSGLAANATGLILGNGTEERAINTNGAFTFQTAQPTGSSYDVRVLTQPYDPNQFCAVENGAGVVANAAVTAPAISCRTYVPKFASSLDFASASYSQYAIDASTGQLRQRGYVKVGRNPVDIAASGFDARISFVVSRGDGLLHAFLRDPVTGRLTEGASSPQATGAIPSPGDFPTTGLRTLTIHPKLPFVYVPNGGGSTSVAGYRFDPSTAALTPIAGSPFTAGAWPLKLAIESTGRFAFVVNTDSRNITSYTIDQTSGALIPNGAAVPTGAENSQYPVIHPSGKFLYVTNGGTSGSISAYTISATGTLTALTGSPFALANNLAIPALFHRSGKYLYVKSVPLDEPGSINALAIDQNTGALSLIGTPAQVGISPTTFHAEPSGRYLFTANRGMQPRTAVTPGSISVLRIDQATGGLQVLPGIDANAPYSVFLDWSGKYLYSASLEGDVVRSYSFNMQTGALAPLADVPEMFVRGAPVSLITIPSATSEPAKFRSKYAYVPDPAGSRILAYSVGDAGVLTPTSGAGPSMELSVVRSVGIAPHSRRLIAVNGAGTVSARSFPIDPATGALGASSAAVAAGTDPYSVVVDPSGRFVYFADPPADRIRAFTLDVQTGSLTSPAPSEAAGPVEVAVHPNGQFLYHAAASQLGVRTIDPTSGALSNAVTTTLGTNNRGLVIHPSGQFAYVARYGIPGAIDTYRIQTFGATVGQLQFVGSVPSLGNSALSIAVHPTGRFVYVANFSSNNVAAFRVSGVDGSLTAIGGPTSLTGSARSVRVDYSGNYLYVVDGVSQVRTFAINATTGALTATAPTGPAATMDPLVVSEDIE